MHYHIALPVGYKSRNLKARATLYKQLASRGIKILLVVTTDAEETYLRKECRIHDVFNLAGEASSTTALTAKEAIARYGHSLRRIYLHFRLIGAAANEDIAAQHFYQMLGGARQLFDQYRITLVLNPMGGDAFLHALALEAKTRNIPVYWIALAPFPNHIFLSPRFNLEWNQNKFFGFSLSSSSKAFAKEYFARLGGKPSLIGVPLGGISLSRAVNALRYLISRKEPRPAIARPLWKYFTDEIRYIARTSIDPIFWRSIPEKAYFFYPLQCSDESAYTIRNFECLRQEMIADLLSRALLEGHELVVKQHPLIRGRDSFRELVHIARLPNVRIVPRHMNALELAKRSKGVITVSGTIGFEAILYRVPVIALGQSYYTNLGYTYDCRNLHQIGKLMDKAISLGAPKQEERDILEFVGRLYQLSYPAGIFNWYHKGDFTSMHVDETTDTIQKLLVDDLPQHVQADIITGEV